MGKIQGYELFTQFNLYGFELTEKYTFEKIKEIILTQFKKDYENKIKKTLQKAGLQYEGMEYISPRYYNYSGDCIALDVSIQNKKTLINYIQENKKEIQELLDKNRSYDGFLSNAEFNTEDIIQKIKENDDISFYVIYYILSNLIENLIQDNYLINVLYEFDLIA